MMIIHANLETFTGRLIYQRVNDSRSVFQQYDCIDVEVRINGSLA